MAALVKSAVDFWRRRERSKVMAIPTRCTLFYKSPPLYA